MDLFQCPAWPWKFRTPNSPAETLSDVGVTEGGYTVTVLAPKGSMDDTLARRLKTRIRFDQPIVSDRWKQDLHLAA